MVIHKAFIHQVNRGHRRKEEDSQAITRPPNLPTLKTFPQSFPSIRTVAHASGPLALNFSLGSSSSSSCICPGSRSGFVSPVHTLSILNASVWILSLKLPCILADSSSFGVLAEVPERVAAAPVAVAIASFVKRSEMALSWISDGKTICASGSRTRGS